VGGGGQAALASCGAAITPCETFRNPEAFDYLVVIGGVQGERGRMDSTALAYLRQAVAPGCRWWDYARVSLP